jgi:hypothetical protein
MFPISYPLFGPSDGGLPFLQKLPLPPCLPPFFLLDPVFSVFYTLPTQEQNSYGRSGGLRIRAAERHCSLQIEDEDNNPL